MATVEAVGELGGLAEMVAGLIRGNLDADPRRARYLRGRAATVNIRVRDAGEVVGLTMGAGRVAVQAAPHPHPDVEIIADAAALMAMSSVPLRFGFPDAASKEGRALARDIVKRSIVVRGLATKPHIVRRLQLLLTVAP